MIPRAEGAGESPGPGEGSGFLPELSLLRPRERERDIIAVTSLAGTGSICLAPQACAPPSPVHPLCPGPALSPGAERTMTEGRVQADAGGQEEGTCRSHPHKRPQPRAVKHHLRAVWGLWPGKVALPHRRWPGTASVWNKGTYYRGAKKAESSRSHPQGLAEVTVPMLALGQSGWWPRASGQGSPAPHASLWSGPPPLG